MGIEMGMNMEEFIDKYYPIISSQRVIEFPEEKARFAYYCNISGMLIPELQEKFGIKAEIESSEIFDEFDYEDEEEFEIEDVELMELYKSKGKTHYNIFPCGHIILDIAYLKDVYNSYSDEKEEIIDLYKRECPCCYKGNRDPHLISQVVPIGGIILKSFIPGRLVKYLKPLLKKGDIIDISGYRGLGLNIYNGEIFTSVPNEATEPMWPLEYLLLRGYKYYHSFHPCFEEFPFEGGVSLIMHGFFIKTGDDDSFELMDKKMEESYAPEYKASDTIRQLDTEVCKVITAPCSDPNYLNDCLLDQDGYYSLKISQWECLFFTPSGLYFGDLDGKELLPVY